MNIVIAQFYDNNIKYGKYSEAINKKYCSQKGYKYFCEKDSAKIHNTLQGKSPTWYKPKLILEIFNNLNPDYILFLDADAIVSGFEKKIEDFIDPKFDIIFAEDIGHHSDMNAGVFLVKNCNWSKTFMEEWWKSGEKFTGNDAKSLDIKTLMPQHMEEVGCFKTCLWHDQTCLTLLYRKNPEYKKHIKIISNHSFNSGDFSKEKFIFHAYTQGHLLFRSLDLVHKKLFPSNRNNFPNLNLIVYHIYCTDDYLSVVEEQLTRLKSSGLYDWCDKLEITCINTQGEFNDIKNLIKDLDKACLNEFTNNDFEFEGINKVWEYSEKYNGKVFYFHTKGVSNKYKVFNEPNSSSTQKIQGIKIWRELLEHFLIDNFETCLKHLNTVEQVGVTSNNKWWWGNFWWSTLESVNFQSKPTTGDRWSYEAWINVGRDPSIYEFFHYNWNPYFTTLPLDFYLKKFKNDIRIVKAEYGTLGVQQDEGRPNSQRVTQDVTNIIQNNFQKNQNKSLNIRIDNETMGGDPIFGIVKVLEIKIKVNNKHYFLTIDEGQHLNINFYE